MVRIMRTFAGALLVTFALHHSASAAFKNSYSDWKSMGATGQAVYAMGLYDMATNSFEGDVISTTVSTALYECAVDLKLTGHMLAEAITKHYQDHTEKWGEYPLQAFYSAVVRGVCLSHVNKSRAAHGLSAWSKG